MINDLGAKNIPCITDGSLRTSMKFHTCTSIGNSLATVPQMVDHGHRAVYDPDEMLHSKQESKHEALFRRNTINGIWYLNTYHLPIEMIARLEVVGFLLQGKQ